MGNLFLCLLLISILVISGCSQMSPRLKTNQDTIRNNDIDCEEEYYPEDHNYYPGEPCRLGDLNCDGGWNVIDMALYMLYIFMYDFYEHPSYGIIGCQADINLDQVIDGDDALIIRNCVLTETCEEYIERRFLPEKGLNS